MPLHENNSATDYAKELFKPWKDSASLQVCNAKNVFLVLVSDFFWWHHKWSTFRLLWLTSSGPWPKLLDGSISLKFLLETRLKFESFDTLHHLLGFGVQKLW